MPRTSSGPEELLWFFMVWGSGAGVCGCGGVGNTNAAAHWCRPNQLGVSLRHIHTYVYIFYSVSLDLFGDLMYSLYVCESCGVAAPWERQTHTVPSEDDGPDNTNLLGTSTGSVISHQSLIAMLKEKCCILLFIVVGVYVTILTRNWVVSWALSKTNE